MTMILDGSLGGTFPSWTTATRPASPVVDPVFPTAPTEQWAAAPTK